MKKDMSLRDKFYVLLAHTRIVIIPEVRLVARGAAEGY